MQTVPINIKGIFRLNICICKAGFSGWDLCHIMGCLVSGQEFLTGKRLVWSVIANMGGKMGEGSSMTFWWTRLHSYIQLKVKTRCLSSFSLAKYFLFSRRLRCRRANTYPQKSKGKRDFFWSRMPALQQQR